MLERSCDRLRPLLVALALAGCSPAPGPEQKAPEPTKEAPQPPPSGPRFVPAPAGEVAASVQAEAGKGGTLVVYVGAAWCEPCREFHAAAQSGRFDRELQGVRFLEFDLDVDRDRLAAAGYVSRLIPLFALPGPDGRASGRQIEGGIKGPQAAEHVLRRLVPLIAEARAGSP